MAARTTSRIDVEGRSLAISNAGKVLYPAAGFTKGHVIDYYVRVSGWLLPHLKDRPVTLKRYPEGVRGKHFYQKDAPRYTPEWVRTFPVPRRTGGKDIRYIVIDDLPTLVWCANLANLELHPFLHRVPRIDRPDAVVFDLDPGEGMGVLDSSRVAFLLKEVLDRLGLRCFPKVSGSKGLQLYIPLNGAAQYDATQAFARDLAALLAREYPESVVSDMSKAVRKSKIFIDWSQNSDFKTTVGVYSLRAKQEQPWVSVPVSWEELRAAVAAGREERLYFAPDAVLKRLEKTGDLFAEVLTLRQKLPRRIG